MKIETQALSHMELRCKMLDATPMRKGQLCPKKNAKLGIHPKI
jgi:hypothetical protein